MCWSVGSVWMRTNCIPMGGPFSTHGADLHSMWRGYVHRHMFRQLGTLAVSTEGFPLWDGPYGKVTLCQFRDNIPVATHAPAEKCARLVNLLRSILHKACGRQVECDCIAPDCDHCTRRCCLGVSEGSRGSNRSGSERHRVRICGTSGTNLPMGLHLCPPPPLMTPGNSYQAYLPSILTGVLKSGLCWTTSWLGQLMSASTWMQVAQLSGFKWESAIRALHKAVQRAYQTSPHAVSATGKCLHPVTRKMPESPCVIVAKIGTWLRKHAYWQHGSYSSWILPPDLAVQGINGAWNDDFLMHRDN